MAAAFRHRPSTYITEALSRSDPVARRRGFIAKAKGLGATVLPQRPERPISIASITLADGTYMACDLETSAAHQMPPASSRYRVR
jgi:hypothetical protein